MLIEKYELLICRDMSFVKKYIYKKRFLNLNECYKKKLQGGNLTPLPCRIRVNIMLKKFVTFKKKLFFISTKVQKVHVNK